MTAFKRASHNDAGDSEAYYWLKPMGGTGSVALNKGKLTVSFVTARPDSGYKLEDLPGLVQALDRARTDILEEKQRREQEAPRKLALSEAEKLEAKAAELAEQAANMRDKAKALKDKWNVPAPVTALVPFSNFDPFLSRSRR